MTARPLEPGDRVYYWAKRHGERAHIKQGRIRDLNVVAGFARVEVTNVPNCPVQLVKIARLKRVIPYTETARLLDRDANP